MTIRQLFCSVNDLVADLENAGGDEARLLQAIREASDVVMKEIGWFIPVTETLKLRGNDRRLLFTPPILAVTGAVQNGESVNLTSADYVLLPQGGHWPNGPYTMLSLQPDALSAVWDCYRPDGVQIPALRGLYRCSIATGTTLDGAIDASATTLSVDDGSQVSPGMVLLVDDEQMLVTGWGSPSAATQLSAAMDANTTVIGVDNGSLLHEGEKVRIEFEQVRVREIQSNQFDGLRGWNRSRAVSHADNTAVSVYRTVTVERAVNGTSAASHADGAAVSRYQAPDDIVFLTKQIATLMVNKARGGYAGKTGNPELGEVYYHDVFPRYELERIKALYELFTD